MTEQELRWKLDQLWGWAKSGKTDDYYLMDRNNVDGFTDQVLRIFRDASRAIDCDCGVADCDGKSTWCTR